MKFRDPETGGFKELYTKAADTLPVGTVVDFEGTEIPAGWEEAEETPTIESGSNNNGDYVKFLDGTMICSLKTASTIYEVTKTYGSAYIIGIGEVNGPAFFHFSQEFIAPPNVSVQVIGSNVGSGGGSPVYVQLNNAGISYIEIMTMVNNKVDLTLDIIAIGRWK